MNANDIDEFYSALDADEFVPALYSIFQGDETTGRDDYEFAQIRRSGERFALWRAYSAETLEFDRLEQCFEQVAEDIRTGETVVTLEKAKKLYPKMFPEFVD